MATADDNHTVICVPSTLKNRKEEWTNTNKNIPFFTSQILESQWTNKSKASDINLGHGFNTVNKLQYNVLASQCKSAINSHNLLAKFS